MNASSGIRVGVLVPPANTVHEREFARLRPANVSFRFGDFSYPPANGDFCEGFLAQLAAPIKTLTEWGADLILVGCTTASMICASEVFSAKLEAMAGVPVITAAEASHRALLALRVRAVSVATPYGMPNNRIIADFLAARGVAVAAIAGMDLDRSVPIWLAAQPSLTAEHVLEFSLSVDVEAAQALYLPCTGMGSLDAIAGFEHRAGKPAFSAVQAGYWASLRRLGIDGRQTGKGRLLEVWDF
jgi:maleate cis-trans isomerase